MAESFKLPGRNDLELYDTAEGLIAIRQTGLSIDEDDPVVLLMPSDVPRIKQALDALVAKIERGD